MAYSINNSRPLLDESDNSDGEELLDNNYSEVTTATATPATSREHDPKTEADLKFNQNAPFDKFNYNYMMFYMLSMTALVPWNFFITAEEYWMFKFRNVTTNSTALTPLQKAITSDLTVASSIPSTLFLILNAFISHLIPLKLRMLGSMWIILVLFATSTGFVEVNTDGWQTEFFVLTLTMLVIMNIFSAIVSGGLFGIAGLFPSEYMTAVVSGQSIGGIFTAVAEIVSLTFGAPPKTTAFVYFMIGNVMLGVCIAGYVIMSRTVFFRYYVGARSRTIASTQIRDPSDSIEHIDSPNYREIFRKIYLYALSEWLVFFVTLSVYPACTVLVQSQYHGNGHLWNDVYFVPVVNYLLFNSGDYMGRILAGIFETPKNRPHLILMLTICRVIFIPIFMVANQSVHTFLPVYIHSDIAFIAIMIVFSVSNGYITNIALIMAPKTVMQHEKELASSMMAACLGMGLAFGSMTSLLLVQML